MTESAANGGVLYVVATPIGNLGDITARALEVLSGVDWVAAEDTRRTGVLLRHFGIATPLLAYHEHNERAVAAALVERLAAGARGALVSDAGTPLVSDPGYALVRAARERGVRVVPLPGASALLAALSASGLPAARFAFEGFLPPRGAARRQRLAALAADERTLVFYEAPHRLEEALADLAAVFGGDRPALLARELTKVYETLHGDTLAGLAAWVAEDPDRRRGECVLLVAGAPERDETQRQEAEGRRVATLLLEELPMKQAVALAARITGAGRNALYRWATACRGPGPGPEGE